MHIEDIPYQAEGATMVGHLAFDDQLPGRRPAVLVSHEGSGLDQHAKGIAERLAALGYIAFALDYFGDGKRPPPSRPSLASTPASPRRGPRIRRISAPAS